MHDILHDVWEILGYQSFMVVSFFIHTFWKILSLKTVVTFLHYLYWLLKLIKQKAEFPLCIRGQVFQVIRLPLYIKTH